MNALRLGLFSLVILAALTQARGSASHNLKEQVDAHVHTTAKRIAGWVEDYYTNRKSETLKRFSKQMVSLRSNADQCSLKKASKLQQLTAMYKDVGACNIFSTLASALAGIFGSVTNLLINSFGSIIGLFTGAAGCFARGPLALPCFLSLGGRLIGNLFTLLPELVVVIVRVVGSVVSIVTGLLGCFHLQQIFEERFDTILNTACLEI